MNVYVVVAALFSAGAHVPVMLLLDVVGKADNEAPEQIADTAVNVGVTGLLTVIVAEPPVNPLVRTQLFASVTDTNV